VGRWGERWGGDFLVLSVRFHDSSPLPRCKHNTLKRACRRHSYVDSTKEIHRCNCPFLFAPLIAGKWGMWGERLKTREPTGEVVSPPRWVESPKWREGDESVILALSESKLSSAARGGSGTCDQRWRTRAGVSCQLHGLHGHRADHHRVSILWRITGLLRTICSLESESGECLIVAPKMILTDAGDPIWSDEHAIV
jgi:hypothetical protein